MAALAIKDKEEIEVPVDTPVFEPIEYWNAERPNEMLVARTPGPKPQNYDAAADLSIKFFAGFFLAKEPWEAELIDTYASDRAFRSDILPPSEPMRCDKCGWETRSSRAYQYHRAQES